jgi:cytochrome P450
MRGDWPFVLAKLHDQYGPVVRYTPNDVSFIGAAAWKDIYGHRTASREAMSKDLRMYRPTLTKSTNILIANDADHSRMRRLLSHAFSEKALRGQEDLILSYVQKLITALRSQTQLKDQSMDLVKWYNFMTFDILGDLSFGQSFGCLDGGGYHPWVESIFHGFKLSTYMQALRRHPSLFPFVKWFLPSQLMRKQSQHQQLSMETAKKRVQQGPTDHPDFMSYILRHTNGKGLTLDEIGENANILIVAGSETTATLLSGVTFWLLKNPQIYDKLLEEIRSSFAKEDDITLEALSRLPYLLAVLKEALRMYPPIPSGLNRIVPDGGALIDGLWVAGKVSACTLPNSMLSLLHRHSYLSVTTLRIVHQQISKIRLHSSLRDGLTTRNMRKMRGT